MPENTKINKPQAIKAIIAGLTLGFVLVILGVVFTDFGVEETKEEVEIIEEVKEKDEELVGQVRIGSGQFHITNIEDKVWKSCHFLINSKYYYPTKSSDWVEGGKIESIKPDEIVSIEMSRFSKTGGERFNLFSVKPQTFTASCDNGFGMWEFK